MVAPTQQDPPTQMMQVQQGSPFPAGGNPFGQGKGSSAGGAVAVAVVDAQHVQALQAIEAMEKELAGELQMGDVLKNQQTSTEEEAAQQQDCLKQQLQKIHAMQGAIESAKAALVQSGGKAERPGPY